jgi:dTDP-4-amino-4,6-dideoxygalactose transaminase
VKVDFYRHALSGDDADAVKCVLQSPFLTTGKVAGAVEEQLRGYFKSPHALLVNSWTNGALALLLAMELKPSDEVIVPAMTFIATANVVVLAGGTPVFVDADPETLLIEPESVAAAITPRTRAVMPVHLYGQMCDMSGLRAIIDAARPHGPPILLIEDCAHCFEGTRDGDRPGTHSDAAVFSFYATKNVTCGEGGAIILNDAALAKKTVEARLHGMSAIAVDRFSGGKYNHWDMNRLGTKANLPDLLAAFLPKQIETIDARLPERTRLADRYRRAFEAGPLRLVTQLSSCVSAEHLFTLGVGHGQRDAAIRVLNEAGIGVTVNYRSVPAMTYYKQAFNTDANRWPIAESWGNETLSLPLFPGLTAAEQDYVIETVKRVVYPLAQ